LYRATSSALAPESIDEDEDMVLDPSDDKNLACDPELRYEAVHQIKVDSNPEAILFASGWLMYTLRSSHLLCYVQLGSWERTTKSFNPHPLDNHVSFSVLNLSLHPSGKVIACQTGDRGAERVLLYGVEPDEVGRLHGGETYLMFRRNAWLVFGRAMMRTTLCCLE
jgi:predicted amidohydrolase